MGTYIDSPKKHPRFEDLTDYDYDIPEKQSRLYVRVQRYTPLAPSTRKRLKGDNFTAVARISFTIDLSFGSGGSCRDPRGFPVVRIHNALVHDPFRIVLPKLTYRRGGRGTLGFASVVEVTSNNFELDGSSLSEYVHRHLEAGILQELQAPRSRWLDKIPKSFRDLSVFDVLYPNEEERKAA